MKYLQGISLISLQKAESYQPGTKLALSKPEGKGCELSFQTPPGWSCLLACLMGGDQPAPSLVLVDPPTKASRRAEGEPSKRGRTCSTPALPQQPPCGGTKAGCSSQNFVGVELVFKGFVALCYSGRAEQVWQRVNDCSEWKGWFCSAGGLLFF